MRLSDTYSGSIIHGFGVWFKQGEIMRLPETVRAGEARGECRRRKKDLAEALGEVEGGDTVRNLKTTLITCFFLTGVKTNVSFFSVQFTVLSSGEKPNAIIMVVVLSMLIEIYPITKPNRSHTFYTLKFSFALKFLTLVDSYWFTYRCHFVIAKFTSTFFGIIISL
jgi:hypothetical protein